MSQVSVDPQSPAPDTIAQAVRVLEQGGIVALPTETVYGLCVDAGNKQAVDRLYAVKGRERDRACAYLLPDRQSCQDHTDGLPPMAQRLVDRFWPGPVTLVVASRDGGTVGLRLPSMALPRSLAQAFGRPLLQTSANRTDEPPALTVEDLAAAFPDDIDLILDGGPTPGGLSSTVVEVTNRSFRILRQGTVPEEEIVAVATRLILIACTGNICRSPLAEAALRRATAEAIQCEQEELTSHGFRFGSFGTMAMVEKPASEHAVSSAADIGLDLTSHRSRPFSIGLLEQAHRVYCLSEGHREFLAPYFEGRTEHVQLLDPKARNIQDPYGRSFRFYRKVASQIVKACERRAKELSSGDSRSMET